jgi:AraC-like DNA-binding protein
LVSKAITPPILAGCVGQYTETAPQHGLREHFQCAWVQQLPEDYAGGIAVVPDGCVDLLWHDDRLVVVGPDIVAARPDLRPGATVLGMRFQPGAAAHWLDLPLTDIVGCGIDMCDIWGQKARDLVEKMQSARSTREQSGLLQELLAQTASSIEPPSRDGTAIFETLRRPLGHEDEPISKLSRKLGVSQRTLRRRSHHLFGYGPKTLERILRFQRFQALVWSAGNGGLAEMALASGYADQAHLNREMQSLCGMTAGEFVRQLTA